MLITKVENDGEITTWKRQVFVLSLAYGTCGVGAAAEGQQSGAQLQTARRPID